MGTTKHTKYTNILTAGLWIANTALASPVLEHVADQVATVDSAVTWTIDPALGDAEAFRVETQGEGTHVIAGGEAGVLYGTQMVMQGECDVVGVDGTPEFGVRGAVLMMLSPSWNYQSDLSPEVYPWFFDRPLMTRYLDYLVSARLNTLVLWSGHLFPHILELPEYPDASQFSAEEIRRNQEQFRWLTQECEKRAITVLTHFYNIHISEHQAKALGREGKDGARFEHPDAWVSDYYRTILRRYLETFPNVGLYICPGESLAQEDQLPWFRDVIFAAVRESGKHPRLVLRDWTMADDFRAALPTIYDDLWSELKHNDETITSPVPDLRHQKWAHVLSGHIVNLHDPADAVPYRVGSPRLLGEMVRNWREAGIFTGAWFYPPQAWVWPHTLDVQADGTDAVLNAWERDPLWHELEGRYLWRAEREPAAETAWAARRLGERLGNAEVGALLVRWYDLTDPILPGLQNLTAVRFGNFFPTSIAWVQTQVDDILSYRTKIDDRPLDGPTGLTGQRYYSQPVDAFTVARYAAEHGPIGAERRSLPIAQVAAMEAAGDALPSDVMRADWLIDTYLAMAEEALNVAQQAAALPSSDPAELQRFVSDSECLIATVRFYRIKVQAAQAKRMLELTADERYAVQLRRLVDESVPAYETLMRTVLQHYAKGTSMWDAKPFQRCLDEKVIPDREKQIQWLIDTGF
ncbi:hypothetical protein [Actomonas aquatica]|uniref:Beta-hexosaminidase bacterial type N-terminal domain-containing protein n=1 Tax=Actomonas aquatica TaxID=2866162 RepID=A0ABZ1CAJ6_9BACT|nr:hypothetical protein [Opitutus sp. WL0086]WRQ88253.1 hypothetical protein K1X11_002470 [Opitutus sp. WL0086]